jgi:hypothetical protein
MIPYKLIIKTRKKESLKGGWMSNNRSRVLPEKIRRKRWEITMDSKNTKQQGKGMKLTEN